MYTPWLAPMLILYAVVVTLVYLTWRHPLFHQIAYALMVVVVTIRSGHNILQMRGLTYILVANHNDNYNHSSMATTTGDLRQEQQYSKRKIGAYPHSIATKLFIVSLLSYIAGFVAWNVDNQFCDELRELRQRLLYQSEDWFGGIGKVFVEYLVIPWLQLHAMWHILTGTATYLFIILSEYIRAILLQLEALIFAFPTSTNYNNSNSFAPNTKYHACLCFYLGFIPYVQYYHSHSA